MCVQLTRRLHIHSHDALSSCISVFYAYAVVTLDDVVLFVDSEQLRDDTKKHLSDAVIVKSYEEIFDYLKSLQANALVSKDKVGVCAVLSA